MTNSKNKCTGCKERFPVEGMIINRAGKFHDLKCLQDYSARNREALVAKGQKMQKTAKRKEEIEEEKAAKEERKRLKQRKEDLKKPSEWLSEAQKWFNRFIRLRDHLLDCISCDRPLIQIQGNDGWKPGGAWDCGHFLTRGARPDLRFNEFNAHKQCKSCNAGSGKFSHKAATVGKRYREKLIDRIGLERVEWLECEANHVLKKPTVDQLKEIIVTYKAKCKELEAAINEC